MKILKIFGIVVGIHVAALILIFANPGCSSTTKPAPSPADTAMQNAPAPAITVPSMAPPPADTGYGPLTPGGFDPNAPAVADASSPSIRFAPTRPNTPAASAVQAAPVENVTPATTYVVKAGDNLWTLQKRFHVDYRDIAAANAIKAGAVLHEGQKLIIPSKSPASGGNGTKAVASTTHGAAPAQKTETPKAEVPKPSGDEVTYTVKPGETIGAIARRFDVSAKELALHNNVQDPLKLRAGTVLSIPGGSWRSVSGSSKPSPTTAPSTPSSPAPQPAEIPNLLESEQTPLPASNNVPVIKIDETPATPTPQS